MTNILLRTILIVGLIGTFNTARGEAAPEAALNLVPEQDEVRVTLQTMTPNFQRFEARFDGGDWAATDSSFLWSIHAGSNRLELRIVNLFGVEGPVSSVEVE